MNTKASEDPSAAIQHSAAHCRTAVNVSVQGTVCTQDIADAGEGLAGLTVVKCGSAMRRAEVAGGCGLMPADAASTSPQPP